MWTSYTRFIAKYRARMRQKEDEMSQNWWFHGRKILGGGNMSPNIFARGTLLLFSTHLLRDTKSIFCHQVQFFCCLNRLKPVITNLGWTRGGGASLQDFRKDTNAPPKFCMTQSHFFVIKLLKVSDNKSEVDNKPEVDGEEKCSFSSFAWFKVNLLSSSSVLLFLSIA